MEAIARDQIFMKIMLTILKYPKYSDGLHFTAV